MSKQKHDLNSVKKKLIFELEDDSMMKPTLCNI